MDEDNDTPNWKDRYQATDPYTRGEVGGILERAFQREHGKEPNELESQQLLFLADESERRAEIAELSAIEAEQAALQAAERYALTGETDDGEAMRRWEAEARAYRREAEALRLEVERLRSYLL